MPRWRILIVTADPHEAQRLHERLVADDFAVDLAADGDSALMCVEAEPPDAILLAARIPGLEARAVARNLAGRPETARIPVLALAGPDDDIVAEMRVPEAGASGEVNAVELVGRVRELLEVRATRDRFEAERTATRRARRAGRRGRGRRRLRLERMLAAAVRELAAIDRGLDAIGRDLAPDDPRPEALRSIVRSLSVRAVEARAFDLFADEPSVGAGRFDLPTFLRAIVHDRTADARDVESALELAVDDGLGAIAADPGRLRIVVEGLVDTVEALSSSDQRPLLRASAEADELVVRLTIAFEPERFANVLEALETSLGGEGAHWRAALVAIDGALLIEPDASGLTLGFTLPFIAAAAPVEPIHTSSSQS